MDEDDRRTDSVSLSVSDHGSQSSWPMTLTIDPGRIVEMSLRCPDGREWQASGQDVFDSLLDLRKQLEPVGIMACCNGARRNAWSSSMQRQMGMGNSVYILRRRRWWNRGRRPDQVSTLGAAPLAEVVSVNDQLAFYESWLPGRTENRSR